MSVFQKQKHTYLVYNHGQMPEDVTLGSLFLDPANPVGNERKAFVHKHTAEDLAEWTGRPQINAPYALSSMVGREWLAGIGVLDTVQANVGTGHHVKVTITASSARRFEIKRLAHQPIAFSPEAFLNEVVLRAEGAYPWLAGKLSVFQRMDRIARLRRAVMRSPRIWMVTGVQYMSGAWVSEAAGQSLSASARVAPPTPLVVAGFTGLPTVEVSGGREASETGVTSYRHADERVWAAQFTALKVRYSSADEVATNVTQASWVHLRDPPDLGPSGARAEEEEEEEEKEEGLASEEFAQVIGVEDEKLNEEEGEDNGSAVLDSMLDVDWYHLDQYLDGEDHS